MDNILFVPSIREMEWVQDILPGASPAELPVAGRRIIEYAFQCAQRFGIIELPIVPLRKPHSGTAARENPRYAPVIAR